MENKANNKLIVVLVAATIFGLAGGVVGSIVARVYLLEKTFNIPLVGDISVPGAQTQGASLVIQGAKNVIVEQNTKVAETNAAAAKILVGIFKKKSAQAAPLSPATGTNFDINDYYELDNEAGQGLVLTSDGWIISSFSPPEAAEYQKAADKNKTSAKANLLSAYVIIDKDGNVYPVDDIVFDSKSDFSFWHIKAIDLPVKRFVTPNEIGNGEVALALNWNSWSWLTSIVGRTMKTSPDAVRSSDNYDGQLVLDGSVPADFFGAFLFNLNGDILGLIDSQGAVYPVNNFIGCINCLLKDRSVEYPFLGVNYIDLSGLTAPGLASGKGALIAKDKSGVAVAKDSPAAADLQAGDIILSANNIELNADHGLNQVVSSLAPGDKIVLSVSRAGRIFTVEVTLGKVKL